MVGKLPEEISFPRGQTPQTAGSLKPITENVIKSASKKKEKDLFSNKDQKILKKKKDKKQKKIPKSILDISNVPSLTYSQLSEGQVLLGWVSAVKEFELRISLPGQLVGTVPITNLSPAYTARLRAAADCTEEEEAADLPGLDTLYNTGDIVACAVVSVTQ